MGLTISHGCFKGSCSTFGEWRKYIASLAGIKLHLMEGFLYPVMMKYYSEKELQDVKDCREKLPIQWDTVDVNEPLLHLLRHSDVDGSIDVKHLTSLADRLESFLPLIEEPKTIHPDDINLTPEMVALGYRYNNVAATVQSILAEYSMLGLTKTFIGGLRNAVSKNESIEFG